MAATTDVLLHCFIRTAWEDGKVEVRLPMDSPGTFLILALEDVFLTAMAWL